jgi:hypothetical protein
VVFGFKTGKKTKDERQKTPPKTVLTIFRLSSLCFKAKDQSQRRKKPPQTLYYRYFLLMYMTLKKHFIGFVGAVTERYNAHFRIAFTIQ